MADDLLAAADSLEKAQPSVDDLDAWIDKLSADVVATVDN